MQERIFDKDMLTDELENDLTNRNELIAIVKGRLKSLPGKKSLHFKNSLEVLKETDPDVL